MFTFSLSPLIISFLSLICFLILHIILWNILEYKGYGIYLLLLLASISYIVTCVLSYYICEISFCLHFWSSFPVYCFLSMFYFLFYFGMDRSVSIRILGEIVKSTNRCIPKDKILEMYSYEEMVESRMNSLTQANWVYKCDNKFGLTRKARFIAKITLCCFRIYNKQTSG